MPKTLLMMMVVLLLMLLLMKMLTTIKLRHDSRPAETNEASNHEEERNVRVDVETLEIETQRRTEVKGGGVKVEGGR